MPVHQIINHSSGGMTGFWFIDEDPEVLFPLAQPVGESEAIYRQFNNLQRKRHWLAWRALLHAMLPDETFQVRYTSEGKPFIPGHRFHLSVSHSGPWAACTLHPKHVAGIDVEALRPRILRVRDRFLSSEELKMHVSVADDIYYLTVLWCIKESVYKFASTQDIDFRRQIKILPLPHSQIGKATSFLRLHNKNLRLSLHYENIDHEYVYARVEQAEAL